MDVSIIIVSYNTCDLLSDCLNSIKEHTIDIDFEVIVVDNNSKDNTISLIEEKYNWVKLIKSPVNLGFGGANNLGVTYSNGKYLFFLNSDTILINNAIKYFYDYAEANPDFGTLGCILFNRDYQPCHSYGNLITPRSELINALAKYLRFLKNESLFHPSLITKPEKVGYITGADLWMNKKVFNKIGGFDTKFFMYCEEVDLQQRLKNRGLDSIVIPGPKIIHLEGGSDSSKSNIWSPSRLKNFYSSKKIYHRKYFKKWIYPFFRISYLLLNYPALFILIIMKNREGYLSLIRYL